MIHYPGPHTDSYHFSNNTNIYPIPKSSDKVNHKVVETSYFNKTQVMNLLCTLSTFDGTIPDPTIKYNLFKEHRD